uniref:NADH-ubiquinone oxidoreductase chain 4 n=1 Tax=Amphimerus sp. JM-2019 TaxID=2588351 RepID=A0A4Y5SE32_9TREM|nr:NADH dehydrogenase subunit 4 [Amphimerus sp. JM-2019]
MSFKGISWYSGLMGVVFTFIFVIVAEHILFLESSLQLRSVGVVWGGVFCFDLVSFYLVLLSVLLGISLLFWSLEMSFISGFMIVLSIFSSLLCYCCVHSVWFWVFYEMSMVPLLVLLVLESPYSERYVASWYLLGYVVFTSLPMLLCLFYLSLESGSFDLRFWGFGEDYAGSVVAYFILAVMFMTKIPLPPFHVWLPMVHAEASSPVSVCLSGYMMKLGVLGVFRFCSSMLPDLVFSAAYVLVCFFCASLFFFSASRELDGKRWLAFLSLCHMMVVAACLCVGDWVLGGLSFLYCLGHGLSAGAMFLFLWLVYEVSGTRNLLLLKNGVSGSSLLRVLACSCLCTACSLPPTVQFFCEVALAGQSFFVSVLFMLVLFAFLFLGGLIPLFLLGLLLTRHCDVNYGGRCVFSSMLSVSFLIVWSFLFFLMS